MSKYIDVEPIIEWAKDPEAQEPYGASGVDWEQKIFNAPTIDISLADDGTLSVKVEDATKVKRVLVEDYDNGDLYYTDRPQGEWVLDPNGMDWNIPAWRCSRCGFVANYIGVEANGIGRNPMNWAGSRFCPNCGCRMKGADDE